jgi:UDP-glucuronate 4-epimerase
MKENPSSSSPILITGAAGFIGFHLAKRLLEEGSHVVGVDNLNDYYNVQLKKDRLAEIASHPHFKFFRTDITARDEFRSIFEASSFGLVLHMAAQAGVRYSLNNPHAYVESNLVGFLNLLENCREFKIPHLVYASSSSVYGTNTEIPFSTNHRTDHPANLYAATKKANELMAHAYAHLYQIPCTGLRFFTVYGPWGRPDMAIFLFTRAILEGRPIDLFNQGKMKRDFTYIDDIVAGVIRISRVVPDPKKMISEKSTDSTPNRIFNIGNNQPVALDSLVELLEKITGKKAKKNLLPLQPGDIPETWAHIEDLQKEIGFAPATSLEKGLQEFVKWFKTYYKIN